MKKTTIVRLTATLLTLSTLVAAQTTNAAVALDRTRVVLDGSTKSVSLNVTNENRELPYLAQAWVEDAQGNKITDPLTALPPVQRVEAGAKSQVKVQVTTGMGQLAQDRESLYYFNLREIPPRSNKPNTLQIALQTRIKLFYRPAALHVADNSKPWQEQVTLIRQGDHYMINNPTPYYVTLSDAAASLKGSTISGFEAVMIAPKSTARLGGTEAALGSSPVLTYINDYGGRPKLVFGCSGNTCSVKTTIEG